MLKKFVPLFLSSLLLSSCFSENTPQNIPLIDTNDTSISSKTKNSDYPETRVDQKRIEGYLSVLSGKMVSADNKIPERGSKEGRLQTRNFIKSQLEGMGYKVEILKYRNNGENVVARLMADTPTDEYILAGAHMDSVSNAGANDNGTGSTSVLELANVMKQTKNRKVNIMFAWFDEEELGLVGSYAMAKDFKKQGLNITSVHTMDMMGWDSDKDRVVEIERPDGNLWDHYVNANKTHGLNLKLVRTDSGSTDHVAFRESGFKSVGLCEEWAGGDTTPHYHRKTDTYDTVDTAYLASSTKLFAAAIYDLSQGVKVKTNGPTIPHNQFIGRERHFHGNH